MLYMFLNFLVSQNQFFTSWYLFIHLHSNYFGHCLHSLVDSP
ncbi:hypothetical protein BVRB_3g069070 [Beta vulgaris subsp. vulgaris]|nr:hypothetical protein BVRB_3g069070 [Beta vulgaris subsp. vulgaris]